MGTTAPTPAPFVELSGEGNYILVQSSLVAGYHRLWNRRRVFVQTGLESLKSDWWGIGQLGVPCFEGLSALRLLFLGGMRPSLDPQFPMHQKYTVYIYLLV